MPYIGNQHNVGDHVNNFKVLDDISSHTATFDGSATSVVSVADDTIRIPEHRFIQGQRVTYTNGGGGNIGGLTSGTAYFVSFDTANTIKLATTLANANNNTVINISAVGSGTSHTLNAAFDGVNTKFKMTHGSGKAARLNNATQLNVAINNVIQRPNQSALSFTEGFAIEDNHKIVFKVAPTVNDIFWGSIIANTIENFDLRDNEVDNFTGDGSATEFTLSTIPANNESVMVTIDGVLQHPSDKNTTRAYTLINSIIQFTAAPALNAEIQVRHIGFAGASTADVSGFYGRTGNVTLTSSDHITTGDITSRNINSSGIVTAATFDGSFSSGVGGSNANFTGIVTAGVFKGGDIEGRNLKITGLSTFVGDASFTGNVSIGGTLTYEDVTNIDSVGIITARNGIDCNGDIDVDGHTNLDNVSVAGVTTFSDDVYFDGATAGRDIVFDRSANTLQVKPNAILKIGEGNGTTISNNGTNTTITHAPVTAFYVSANTFQVFGSGNRSGNVYDNTLLRLHNGVAELGHEIPNGGAAGIKLATSAKGITVGTGVTIETNGQATFVGIITATDGIIINADNKILKIGASEDIHIFHQGGTSIIKDINDNPINIQSDGEIKLAKDGNAETYARFIPDGAVELYWNNEKKLQTNYEGIQVYDSSSTQSMVKMNTSGGFAGSLYGVGNSVIALLRANLQWGIKVNSGGATELYHTGNAKKLETTSTGILINQDLDVDGHTNLDNVSVAGIVTVSTSTQYGGYKLGNNSNIVAELVGLSGSNDTGALALWHGGYKKVQLSALGASYLTGGRVGIGTDNPQARLEVKDNISTNFGTTVRLSQSYNSVFSEISSNFGGSMTLNAGQGASTAVMHFQVNDSEKMRLTSSGRLGIGTDNPGSPIEIYGTGAATVMEINGTGRYRGYEIHESGTRKAYFFHDATNNEAILNTAEGTLQFAIGDTPVMRLNSNGDLVFKDGVGQGNSLSSKIIVTDSSDNVQYEIGMLSTSNEDLYFSNSRNSNIRFRTNNLERLHIQANGDVYLNPTVGSTAVNSGAIRRFNAGLDYWSGTAGSANAIKYAVHGQSDDNMYGMGVSSSLLELQSQVDIAFFAGGAGSGTGRRVERARISGSSGLFDVVGSARATNFIMRGNGSAPTADASVYRSADNTLAFATGSTQRVLLTNSLFNITGGNLHVGADNATTNYTDSNLGNTKHIEIGATGGGDALLTTHCSGYGIGYFGYHSGGDRLVIACDQGGGNNSIDLITTAGTSSGGNTDNLHNKSPRFQIRGNGGFRAEYTDSNEVHAISNYDHGNHNYSHRNNRVLTSNGAGWDGNESTDGADPILILSVADRAGNSDIGDAYGLCLHSDSQDNNDYGPLIGWSNRSNSGAYNTTYAAIVGQKTGQATDHNWSSGALHFFTNKPGTGSYMTNVADMSIDENGIIKMPRNCRFYALNNSGSSDSANGQTGKISDMFETELVDSNGDYDTGNGRFTAPVDGAYEFHFAALHRAMSNAGHGELTFYKNGSNSLTPRSFGYSNIGSGGSINDHQHLHIHGIFNLSAGDYIEVYIYAQTSGMDFYTYQGLGYFSGKLLG